MLPYCLRFRQPDRQDCLLYDPDECGTVVKTGQERPLFELPRPRAIPWDATWIIQMRMRISKKGMYESRHVGILVLRNILQSCVQPYPQSLILTLFHIFFVFLRHPHLSPRRQTHCPPTSPLSCIQHVLYTHFNPESTSYNYFCSAPPPSARLRAGHQTRPVTPFRTPS